MKKLIRRCFWWVIQFLEVQFFLSLVSFPILIAWGIPFSCATLLGNFIFIPFLTLFLLFSSLIFFLELIGVSSSWFCCGLNIIADCWVLILSWGQKSWLIGFPENVFFVALSIAILCFVLLQHKIFGKSGVYTLLLSMLFFGFIYYVSFYNKGFKQIVVPCGNKKAEITLIYTTMILKDNGAFGCKKSNGSWVQYTLIPELIKKMGSQIIEKVIVDESNGNSFTALKELCLHVCVKSIVLPYFLRTLEKNEWRSYYALMEVVKKENIKVIRK